MQTHFFRGRRLRQTEALRDLVRETAPLMTEDLIMPYFVVDTQDVQYKKEIASMPGQYQLSLAQLEERVVRAYDLGLKSVLLFGLPASKDEKASGAYDKNGIVQQAVRRLKKSCP
ncbi:MAG: porphobilinogen synthase, partial [Desulfovibrio sp.]|nr:porphobilinogen synthase [Desulfovibrio sp.]